MPWITIVEDFDKICDSLNDYDLEFDVRLDYSGRGMYGKTCVSFVTRNPVKLTMALAAVLATYESEDDDYNGVCWYDLNPALDSMGTSSVVYFPNWTVA